MDRSPTSNRLLLDLGKGHGPAVLVQRARVLLLLEFEMLTAAARRTRALLPTRETPALERREQLSLAESGKRAHHSEAVTPTHTQNKQRPAMYAARSSSRPHLPKNLLPPLP